MVNKPWLNNGIANVEKPLLFNHGLYMVLKWFKNHSFLTVAISWFNCGFFNDGFLTMVKPLNNHR